MHLLNWWFSFTQKGAYRNSSGRRINWKPVCPAMKSGPFQKGPAEFIKIVKTINLWKGKGQTALTGLIQLKRVAVYDPFVVKSPKLINPARVGREGDLVVTYPSYITLL